MARRPGPPGSATDRNARKYPWKKPAGIGWQHGRKPAAPKDLGQAAKRAWQVWLGSWWAGFYTPDDLPGLELLARQYNLVMLGMLDVSKVIPLMDRYGITPEGRQKLRWAPPDEVEEPKVKKPAVADQVAAKRAERGRSVS